MTLGPPFRVMQRFQYTLLYQVYILSFDFHAMNHSDTAPYGYVSSTDIGSP